MAVSHRTSVSSINLGTINLVIVLSGSVIILANLAQAASRQSIIDCEAQLTSGFVRQFNRAGLNGITTAYLLVEASQGDGISDAISEYEALISKLQSNGLSIIDRESIEGNHHFLRVRGSANAYRSILGSTPAIHWVGLGKDQNTFATVQARRVPPQQTSSVANVRYVFMFTSAATFEAAKPLIAQLGLAIKDEIKNLHALLLEGTQAAIDQAKRINGVDSTEPEVKYSLPHSLPPRTVRVYHPSVAGELINYLQQAADLNKIVTIAVVTTGLPSDAGYAAQIANSRRAVNAVEQFWNQRAADGIVVKNKFEGLGMVIISGPANIIRAVLSGDLADTENVSLFQDGTVSIPE